MKKLFALLLALSLLASLTACLAEAENPSFEAGGYTITYEVVAQDQVDAVVGDLAQWVDTEGVDMEANRLLYIHYTSATQNGEEMQLGRVFMGLSWGNLVFTVDGVDYTQDSLLMSSGTQTYLTYLFVPADTPDDVAVSIQYK